MYASSTSIQIETWPIARLLPYARNPRKNDQASGPNVCFHPGVRI
jgi:hypothetical protein